MKVLASLLSLVAAEFGASYACADWRRHSVVGMLAENSVVSLKSGVDPQFVAFSIIERLSHDAVDSIGVKLLSNCLFS